MKLDGFIPYDKAAADLYSRRRWWLGLTLGDMLDKASDLYPSQEALVGGGKRYTYRKLRSLVHRMAYNLLEEGLRPGDRVLLQLPNWTEFVISYFACQKAGLVVVLLTVNHTGREIVHLADLTQPKAWIVPSRYRKTDYLAQVNDVQRQHPGLEKVIVVGEQLPTAIYDLTICSRQGLLTTRSGQLSKKHPPIPPMSARFFRRVALRVYPKEHREPTVITSATWSTNLGLGTSM